MLDPADPMHGVTERTMTMEVTPGQFDQMAKTQVGPGVERVTYKFAVGPFSLPGSWVVVATTIRQEPPATTHMVTFARLEG